MGTHSRQHNELERLSPSNSLSSTRLRLVHPLTPCPSYTISLLHHLPFIHRNTLHARCVKACLNRRNAIAYVLPTEWWRTKERNIQTISVFMVSCQGHDLDLNFFNQSTTLKEIRLHRKFQVNPTCCSEDINDFGFQGHMSR